MPGGGGGNSTGGTGGGSTNGTTCTGTDCTGNSNSTDGSDVGRQLPGCDESKFELCVCVCMQHHWGSDTAVCVSLSI